MNSSINDKIKKVNFCLSEITQKQIRELSQQWDRSISSAIRQIIKDAYKRSIDHGNA